MELRWLVAIGVWLLVASFVTVADRKHARELAATGFDRFGDWRKTRRWSVHAGFATAGISAMYLALGQPIGAVGALVVVGGPALLLWRVSRRGETHERIHGRQPRDS